MENEGNQKGLLNREKWKHEVKQERKTTTHRNKNTRWRISKINIIIILWDRRHQVRLQVQRVFWLDGYGKIEQIVPSLA